MAPIYLFSRQFSVNILSGKIEGPLFNEVRMRWFKHYNNASISNTLTVLIAKFGMEGYGRYWLLLEAMCQKFDGENDTIFVFSTKDLRKMLGLYHTNGLRMYLQCMVNVGLMSFECDDYVTTITTDILLRLQGRDYKKARSKRGETAPKNKTKIKNKTKKEKPQKPVFDFDSIYALYPGNKPGKTAGIKKLEKQIKTEKDFQKLKKQVENYSNQCQNKNTKNEFIKHFSTFVNNREDYNETVKSKTETANEVMKLYDFSQPDATTAH